MSGYNLPPGCRENDIPGNRPEDQEWEAFFDWLVEATEWRMMSVSRLKSIINQALEQDDLNEGRIEPDEPEDKR